MMMTSAFGIGGLNVYLFRFSWITVDEYSESPQEILCEFTRELPIHGRYQHNHISDGVSCKIQGKLLNVPPFLSRET